jgi:hypothetical protein
MDARTGAGTEASNYRMNLPRETPAGYPGVPPTERQPRE